MGYEAAIGYLYGLQKHGIKLGLDNPRELLRRLGNPERSMKFIHVAGTNGKGSTCAATASMLRSAGKKTGLFTSPHMISFTERIKVNGHEITEAEVVELAAYLKDISAGLNPTFFEIVTAMGLLHFKQSGVQWAVMETGMGGRLDATNVVTPEAAVITSIGLDHKEFLGETIIEIAGEKAGIIKPNIPVIAAGCNGPEWDAIEKIADDNRSPLYMAGRDFDYKIESHSANGVVFDYASSALNIKSIKTPLAGEYQALNASMAIKAFELISGKIGTKNIEAVIRAGFDNLRWGGRLERIGSNPDMYIDGAHNPQASAALANALKIDFMRDKPELCLVMGVMGDKDIDGILSPLLKIATIAILTAPKYDRSASIDAMARAAANASVKCKIITSPTVKDAMDEARKWASISPDKRMAVITGSFYTMGEALESMGYNGVLTTLRETRGPAKN